MLRRFVHYLCPDRQRERGAVTVWNNRCGLIKTHPNATGQRSRVTQKPRILIIVSRAGLAGCWQSEA